MGNNKKNSFKEIKEKLAKRLVGWKEKLLSKAGKETLIKVVAQAIQTYAMSCFKIPDSLCEEKTRDRKSTRLNSSHPLKSRMPSSA